MIRVENLNFEYPSKRVLHDISFEIKKGQITALVGPNGAGKTTLMRNIAALDDPFSGKIFIDDLDVQHEPRKAHRVTGYLSDFFGLYDQLTVEQCLTYMAWSHGLRGSALEEKIDWATSMLELTDYRNEKAENLSRGLRQRLAIAQCILHDPKVILLDEPASGLDPEARHGLSQLILNLQKMGITLIVSSHILAELEDYCTDMLIIREGEILEHIKIKDIQKDNQNLFEIKLLDTKEAYIKKIAAITGVDAPSYIGDNTMRFNFTGDSMAQHTLLKQLIKDKIPLIQFRTRESTLQDAYMSLSKKNKTVKEDSDTIAIEDATSDIHTKEDK